MREVCCLGLVLAACTANRAIHKRWERTPPPPDPGHSPLSIVYREMPLLDESRLPVPVEWPVDERDPALDTVAAVVAEATLRDHVMAVDELRAAMLSARGSKLLPHVLTARGDEAVIAVQLSRALAELRANTTLDGIGVATIDGPGGPVTALVAVEWSELTAQVTRDGPTATVELPWDWATPPSAFVVMPLTTERIEATVADGRAQIVIDCAEYLDADVEVDANRRTVVSVVAPCGATAAGASDSSAPPATTVTEFEQRLFEMMVRERVAHGRAPLEWDPVAQELARAHSADMAAARYIGHTGSAGDHLTDRVEYVDLPARQAFENVGHADGPSEAHQAFLDSPGHRANLMARRARRGAVGVAPDPHNWGAYYVTELLYEPSTSKR